MAIAPLIYSLTASAPGRKKGVLCLVVHHKGSTARGVCVVKGLISPNMEYWNQKAQRFLGGTQIDVDNNKILEELLAKCESLANNPKVASVPQFVELVYEQETPASIETFGGFLQTLIERMKTGQNNKRPSKHYQIYLNLLHKLEQEGVIINLPVEEVGNKHFIQFSDFLIDLHRKTGFSNYLNVMSYFKQVHKKAFEQEKNDNVLRFRYLDAAPMKEVNEKGTPLSLNQYHQFKTLRVQEVPYVGYAKNYYAELYRDFCVFLYEAKMRPVDVVKAHSSGLEMKNDQMYLRYIAEKKKNSREKNKITYAPLNNTCLLIIKKYEGKSAQGYLFPFSMNDYKWDFHDPEHWNKWNNRKAKVIEMINRWLKRVSKYMELDFEMTTYTFRRSALSHACMASNNYMKIALEAATSPDMLLQHYVSNIV